MSLKIRLTLLYATIVGGIIILFGVGIYALVSVILVDQIDKTLERTWRDIQRVVRVNSQGRFEYVTGLSLDANVFVQIWGRDGELKGGSPNIRRLLDSLDPEGLQSAVPIYQDTFIETVHLRVLSVPLEVGGRSFATLQIGANMDVVDGTQNDLLVSLIFASIVAISFAFIIGWLSTQSAIAPLEAVTLAALQITETNDLSRRIPQAGPSDDEVGQLIRAFNLNLSRLERLIETQRRFLADVGHELRTPLTVIKGNVDLIRRIGETDEESLESIEDEVERLTRLVGDLLLLAQAEAGKLPMDRQIVDLDTVLLEVFRQAKILAKSQIHLKIGDIDQVLVCGDRDRLKQVLLNLISNGIKYTPSGGQVIVSLGKRDNYALLNVADNGPGVPKEDLPHIF